MGVSENSGTPKSSILIGFSIINHPFWGTPIFGNTHISADPVVPGGARQRSYANCEFLGGVAVRSRVVRRCGSG